MSGERDFYVTFKKGKQRGSWRARVRARSATEAEGIIRRKYRAVDPQEVKAKTAP